MKIKQLNKR